MAKCGTGFQEIYRHACCLQAQTDLCASAVASPASHARRTVLSLSQIAGTDVTGHDRPHDRPSSIVQQNKALPSIGLSSDVVLMLEKLQILQQEGLHFAARV